MHKLLVPYDSSPEAGRAMAYALTLAREHGEMILHLVHVHDEPGVAGEVRAFLPVGEVKALDEEESREALSAAIEAASAAGVPFSTEMLKGPVAETIVAAAEKANCDAIVMGSTGKGAVANLLAGSVALQVVHLAKVPVTLVK